MNEAASPRERIRTPASDARYARNGAQAVGDRAARPKSRPAIIRSALENSALRGIPPYLSVGGPRGRLAAAVHPAVHARAVAHAGLTARRRAVAVHPRARAAATRTVAATATRSEPSLELQRVGAVVVLLQFRRERDAARRRV